jgi:hypothetical protein
MENLFELTNNIPFEEKYFYIEDAISLCSMAETALLSYKNKELAKRIYCKSINSNCSSYDFSQIGKSIKSVIGDFSWASSVFLLAERKAKTSFDFWFLASMYNYYPEKAYNLLEKSIFIAYSSNEFVNISSVFINSFHDKDNCFRVLNLAEDNIKTVNDSLIVASNYYKLLSEVSKTKEIIKKTYSKATNFIDKAKLIKFCICSNVKPDNFELLLENTFYSIEVTEDYTELMKILVLNYPDKIKVKESYPDNIFFTSPEITNISKYITIEFVNRPWTDELIKKVNGELPTSSSDSCIYKYLVLSIKNSKVSPTELQFTYRIYLKN